MNRELCKLFNVDLLNKYEKFVKMFNTNMEVIKFLPSHLEKEYLYDLELTKKSLEEKDEKSYRELFLKHVELLKSLQSFNLNSLAFKAFIEIEKNESIKNNLSSFNDKRNQNIVYELTSTISGRMIVKNGPNILTLPNRCRKIFNSKWTNNGKLLSVDFKNLEPRVVKKILGDNVAYDIYNEILDQLEFKNEIDRSLIKKAVISVMYGKTSPIEGISTERSNIILEKTRDYFKLDSILEKASHIKNEEYRTNYFGRPIHNKNEESSHKIINNFVQSTAVDIALSYFYELTESMKDLNVRPLFLIHDAIVFDVHNDDFKEFVNRVNEGYNNKDLGYFPVEITNFTNGEKLIA